MKAAEVVGGLLLAAVLISGVLAVQGVVIMLVLAGLHSYVSESIPAIGFVGSTLIGLGLGVVGSFFRRGAA